MGTFFSGLSAMGCPPFFFELGATEGELREERLRHAKNITAAATTADRIDTYTILSYKDPRNGGRDRECAGGHTSVALRSSVPTLTWSAIFAGCRPKAKINGEITSRRKWSVPIELDCSCGSLYMQDVVQHSAGTRNARPGHVNKRHLLH